MEGLSVKKIPFGSQLHTRLKEALCYRYERSLRKMKERFVKWEESEDLFASYVVESEEEKVRREGRKTGKQSYSVIYIPYSYAMAMAVFTYWAQVFLARSPVFQYTARHGEGHQKVQAVDALIDYQVQVGRCLLILYFWLMDAVKYGIGIVGSYWAEEKSTFSYYADEPVTEGGVPIIGKFRRKLVTEEAQGYQGNRLFNVRPYDFLPDPSVGYATLQQGSYCGRVTHLSWNDLVKGEQDGIYFNVSEAEKVYNTLSERERGSPREELPDWAGEGSFDTFAVASEDERRRVRLFRVVEMVCEVQPREWGLGPSSYPEKWVFSLVEEEVVIQARPLGARHGLFPFFIQSFEVNGYSIAPRGLLEILKPLNDTLSWLFNARMFNVRKSMNDQFVVDPQRVSLKDILDGGPGKLIRLNPQYYGTDVRTVLAQLPVNDTTRNHIRDAQIVMEVMQRVSGATDNMMGVLDPGGRKTATEVRTSAGFGVSRLKVLAEFNSAQGWLPLSSAMLMNTQQHYDQRQKFKIAGDLLGDNPQFLDISPEDIQGFFDFVPVDGTLPIDRFAQSTLWTEILKMIAGFPQLAQSYDVAGIFAWMAQLAGLKNITQFRQAAGLPGQTPGIVPVPDERLMDESRKGNVRRTTNGTGTPLLQAQGVRQPS